MTPLLDFLLLSPALLFSAPYFYIYVSSPCSISTSQMSLKRKPRLHPILNPRNKTKENNALDCFHHQYFVP